MFSTLLYAAIAAAIFCFSFVNAVPHRATDTSSQHRGREKRDVITSNVLPLRRAAGPIPSRQRLVGVNEEIVKRDDGSYRWGSTALRWQDQAQNLVTSITVDGQEFTVLVDTSSSDTWIATSSVECVSIKTLKSSPQSSCAFGSLYHTPSSTRTLPASLNITYGDSQFVTGAMVIASVSIAQLSLPSQEIALVTHAAWQGDSLTSGILGLGFPSITNAFSGTDPRTASGSTHAPYSPVFPSLYGSGVVGSYFSLALERPSGTSDGEPAGYLAFGGIPSVKTIGNWLTSPIIKSTSSFFNGSKIAPEYQFYNIQLDAIVYQQALPDKSNPATVIAGMAKSESSKSGSDSSDKTAFPAIIGSASALMYFPTPIADELNALFDPPVVKSNNVYTIPCHTTAPTIGISIAGDIFWIESEDLVLKMGDGSCVSGIADGGEGNGAIYELGDPFLKNVLAVFNMGEGEMRFIRRA